MNPRNSFAVLGLLCLFSTAIIYTNFISTGSVWKSTFPRDNATINSSHIFMDRANISGEDIGEPAYAALHISPRSLKLVEREKKYLRFLNATEAIQRSQDKRKTKRLPDVINIGVEKCGTGFLREILKRHPMFIFPAKAESHFFSFGWNPNNSTELYRNEMPEAEDYQIVIEKSPSYFNFASKMVPFRMKQVVPHAKIIVVLCDPVNRTFSDFVHEIIMKNIANGTDFDVMARRIIRITKNIAAFKDDQDKVTNFLFTTLSTATNYHLVSTALYYYHLKRWFRAFNRRQFFIIDGEELMYNPGKVAEELQDFLKIPKLIITEDFEKGPNGFYCIHKPIPIRKAGKRLIVQGDLDCLFSADKGRTRFGHSKYHPSVRTMSTLRDFFQPYNEKLYRLLGRKFKWQ